MNTAILCIGEALIDMICTDKGLPLSQGVNFLKKAGGAPTNVAAAIGAMGGQAHMFACVGNDPFGKHLIDEIQSFNVHTQYMRQHETHFTTLAFVSLMLNGERDFYFNRGADAYLSLDDAAELPMERFGIVHFGSATAFLDGPLNKTYYYLLHQAQAQGAVIAFDPNYRQLLFGQNQASFIKQSAVFVEACNFCKLSEEEALLITAASTIQQAAQILLTTTEAVFVITLGSKGSLLGLHGNTYLVPTSPVTAVDTTGAGDAFMGAMLYQLQKLDPETIQNLPKETWVKFVENANAAGAEACKYMGAMEAFRHLNNLKFL